MDTGDFDVSLLKINIFHTANASQAMQPYACAWEPGRENGEKLITSTWNALARFVCLSWENEEMQKGS